MPLGGVPAARRTVTTGPPIRPRTVCGIRPATAGGITFVNVEDETGILNVIVSKGVWHRYRRIARASPAMVVRGILERSEDGVTNLIADRLEHLTIHVQAKSRDFQ